MVALLFQNAQQIIDLTNTMKQKDRELQLKEEK